MHTSEAEAAKAKERVVGKVSRSALIKARKHYERLRVPLHAQQRSRLTSTYPDARDVNALCGTNLVT